MLDFNFSLQNINLTVKNFRRIKFIWKILQTKLENDYIKFYTNIKMKDSVRQSLSK